MSSFSEWLSTTDEKKLAEYADMFKMFANCGKSEEQIKELFLKSIGISDFYFENLKAYYFEKFHTDSSSAVVRGSRYKDQMNWYTPVKLGDVNPNSRWGKLVSRLKNSKGWKDEHIEALHHQSNDVVSSLAPPKSLEPDTVKGLVLGYVQSGKTTNFAASIAKACDEGYNFVLVLSGIHNELRYQTEKRLRNDLSNSDIKSLNLTKDDKSGDFKKPNDSFDKYINMADVTFAVVKKNKPVLEKLYNWLNEAKDPSTAKVLIIDDEADQASINNAKDENDQSAVHRCIRDIIKVFSEKTVVSYVGYTATPFANIMINASCEDDLFPSDFILSLEPPESYYGAEKLFGRARVNEDRGVSGMDVIRFIDDYDGGKSHKELEPSIKHAIHTFILAGAERIARHESNVHQNITMLINNSKRKIDHSLTYNQVNSYVEELRYQIENKNTALITKLKKIWKEDVSRVSDDQSVGLVLRQEDFLDTVTHLINSLKVFKSNSDSSDFPDFESGSEKSIIIGGDKLSRGLTIEGLTVSYFDRTSKGYDTLLQMGRWFGYRPGYVDLTRIFVTKNTAANFYHLATVEQELREQINELNEDELSSPDQVALMIRDHDDLRPTASIQFAKNKEFSALSYSGKKYQATRIMVNDLEVLNQNYNTVVNLIANLEQEKKKAESRLNEMKYGNIYKNVNPEKVVRFLKEFKFSRYDKSFNYNLIGQYIEKLSEQGELQNWSVVLASLKPGDEAKKIDVGDTGISVYAASRTVKRYINNDDGSVTIDNVLIAQQELSDLEDLAILDGYDSLSKFSSDKKPKFKTLRRNRPIDRGLLVIQPLYGKWDQQDQWLNDKDGKLRHHLHSKCSKIFSVAIVLPYTKHPQCEFTYVKNSSIKVA